MGVQPASQRLHSAPRPHLNHLNVHAASGHDHLVLVELRPWIPQLYRKMTAKKLRKLKKSKKYQRFQMVRHSRDSSGHWKVWRAKCKASAIHACIIIVSFTCRCSCVDQSLIYTELRQGGRDMTKSAEYPMGYGQKVNSLHTKHMVRY